MERKKERIGKVRKKERKKDWISFPWYSHWRISCGVETLLVRQFSIISFHSLFPFLSLFLSLSLSLPPFYSMYVKCTVFPTTINATHGWLKFSLEEKSGTHSILSKMNPCKNVKWMSVCECVCVCGCERERKREQEPFVFSRVRDVKIDQDKVNSVTRLDLVTFLFFLVSFLRYFLSQISLRQPTSVFNQM